MSLKRVDFTVAENVKADSTIKCEKLIEAAKVLADWVMTITDEREQNIAIEIVLQGFTHENNTFSSAEFQKITQGFFEPSRAGQMAMFNTLIGRQELPKPKTDTTNEDKS